MSENWPKKRRKLLAAVLAVVDCLLLGAIIWVLLSDGGKDGSEASASPADSPEAQTSPAQETLLPVESDDGPSVECVLDYSKKAVNVQDPSENYDWLHRVRLPRLVWNSDNAEAFNAEIMEYSSIADELRAGEEGSALYDISYEYSINNGLVAIMLCCTYAQQDAGTYHDYVGFYYDTQLDCQLDCYGYIEALGGDMDSLIRQAEEQRLSGESWYITSAGGDAVLYDAGVYVVELVISNTVSGTVSSELISVEPAVSTSYVQQDVGWVYSVRGHSFFVPEGFVQLEDTIPPSGYRYIYYSSALDMTITVWESTIYYLPFDTGEEWLQSDYEQYQGRDCSYLVQGDDYMVASGYDENGDVYYLREQFEGVEVMTYMITHPAGYLEECSALTEQFARDFEF